MLQNLLKQINYNSIYPLLVSQIKSMRKEVSWLQAIAGRRKIK
ncbi:hypothetical protein NSP_50670 [Nodularia spumigena CCY9414]|nr:hypothetical protein NSP_50670 [Nodularia spumigena CCY9414]